MLALSILLQFFSRILTHHPNAAHPKFPGKGERSSFLILYPGLGPVSSSSLRALDSLLGLLHLLLGLSHDALGPLVRGVVNDNARDLDDADDTKEEVDGGEQVVLGLDDEAPAGPNEARGRQRGVLRQRELLGRAGKVGDTGEDEGPLFVVVGDG